MSREVNRIFHCFRWTLKDIKTNVKYISKQGFTTILTTGVQPHKPINEKYYDSEWWKYYQCYDFSIGNDLGSKEDLIELAKECNKYNVKLMVDIVCNHIAGDDYGNLIPHPDVNELLKSKWFYKEAKNIEDYNDEYDFTHHCIGLPGLNLQNYELANIIKRFLDELIECGVSDFRIDAGKHIGLPRDGIDFFERIIKTYCDNGHFIMSEILDSSYEFIGEASKYCKILTNMTGYNHDDIVVFASSHDTDLNKNEVGYTRNLNEETIIMDYIELTKYYPNTLFYPRPFSRRWEGQDIRKANNNLR